MSMANILRIIIIFVMVFLFLCGSIILKELPCYAAPGDTLLVSSISNVGFGGTAVNYGVRTEVARFTNNSGVNIWYSMIQYKATGAWGALVQYGMGTRYDVNGTLRIEVRKNNVNGEVIFDETRNIVNGMMNQSVFYFTPSWLPNVTLRSGETLHWVITQNLTVSGGTKLNLSVYTDPNVRWVINYWQSDALVQQSVDNAYNAMNAAYQARDAANNANSNAWNAWNALANGPWSNGKSLSATWDQANAANNAASLARDRTWYSGKYGGTAESTADIAGYIRNTQLPNLETKINNLQTSVTNIQNADNLPPSVEIDTVSGAKATSSSSIQLIVAASDNKSSTFTYSVNGGGYSSLPADGKITVSLPAVGPNTVTVRVKDDAGNVTTKTIKIWRLS